MSEAIEIARGSGVATEVSHLTPNMVAGILWNGLDSIDEARTAVSISRSIFTLMKSVRLLPNTLTRPQSGRH